MLNRLPDWNRVEAIVSKCMARLDEQYAALDLGLADLSVVILAHRFQTRRLLTFDEREQNTGGTSYDMAEDALGVST